MSETREFAVIRATVPNGNAHAVYLIDAEDLQEFGNNIAGYFPPRTRDVTEIGRIQVLGDTHLLVTMYEESL